jgi:hypothetical protein
MTTPISGSAKIYTFPPRGRFALRMIDGEPGAATNLQLPRGATLTAGSGSWYHDEAIADAREGEAGRKN